MAQPIWITPAGSLGIFPSLTGITPIQLNAVPVLPATYLDFIITSGELPPGLKLDFNGFISGIPEIVPELTTFYFTVRVKDNNDNLADRYFSMGISGSANPVITTLPGLLFRMEDSIWKEFSINYTNPIVTNPTRFSIKSGNLPEGLEINDAGIITGYPAPPVVEITLPVITTNALSTVAYNPSAVSTSNYINCISTIGFTVNRPVVFTTNLGNISAGAVYYIKKVVSSTRFKISEVQDGPEYKLTAATNLSAVTLLPIKQGKPVVRESNFTVLLESPLGDSEQKFSIQIINQNLPVTSGGPGKVMGTREPVILNTRPETLNLNDTNKYYGYYFLKDDPRDPVYSITETVNIGTYKSGNYFAFKVIGKNFDNQVLEYQFRNLPPGLVGNRTTGWITGNLALAQPGVNLYAFSVKVYNKSNISIDSDYFNFSMYVVKEMSEVVTWNTDTDLGYIFNGTLSSLYIQASADVDLSYEFIDGKLPPNLSIDSTGQITGYVAYQPTENVLRKNAETVFTFSIRAFSPKFPAITSIKTFTISVKQKFANPTDTLYMKAAPSEQNRLLIRSLLNNDEIIPTDYLFRPNDEYYGKAKDVIYEHAYGIYASDIQKYLTAEVINHYWRNITLGSIATAEAKDSNGNTLYEVVYSKIIDNQINPKGQSIHKEIGWPVPISLNLGPWLSSETEIFTSYEQLQNQDFYTSQTPGSAIVFFPNSLPNMRKQIGDVLGQEYDTDVLPLWMTSQQKDGNTLGFTPAWVICYCKPGTTVGADGVSRSYAGQIKFNIETNWTDPSGKTLKLNQINFQLDRFSVDKSLTYNYETTVTPPAWTGLPSATPTPDPLDSKDFSVLFPRKTILPNKTQL